MSLLSIPAPENATDRSRDARLRFRVESGGRFIQDRQRGEDDS